MATPNSRGVDTRRVALRVPEQVKTAFEQRVAENRVGKPSRYVSVLEDELLAELGIGTPGDLVDAVYSLARTHEETDRENNFCSVPGADGSGVAIQYYIDEGLRDQLVNAAERADTVETAGEYLAKIMWRYAESDGYKSRAAARAGRVEGATRALASDTDAVERRTETIIAAADIEADGQTSFTRGELREGVAAARGPSVQTGVLGDTEQQYLDRVLDRLGYVWIRGDTFGDPDEHDSAPLAEKPYEYLTDDEKIQRIRDAALDRANSTTTTGGGYKFDHAEAKVALDNRPNSAIALMQTVADEFDEFRYDASDRVLFVDPTDGETGESDTDDDETEKTGDWVDAVLRQFDNIKRAAEEEYPAVTYQLRIAETLEMSKSDVTADQVAELKERAREVTGTDNTGGSDTTDDVGGGGLTGETTTPDADLVDEPDLTEDSDSAAPASTATADDASTPSATGGDTGESDTDDDGGDGWIRDVVDRLGADLETVADLPDAVIRTAIAKHRHGTTDTREARHRDRVADDNVTAVRTYAEGAAVSDSSDDATEDTTDLGTDARDELNALAAGTPANATVTTDGGSDGDDDGGDDDTRILRPDSGTASVDVGRTADMLECRSLGRNPHCPACGGQLRKTDHSLTVECIRSTCRRRVSLVDVVEQIDDGGTDPPPDPDD